MAIKIIILLIYPGKTFCKIYVFIYTNYIVCQNVYSIIFEIMYNNIIQKSQSEMKVQNEEIERKQDEMKVKQHLSVVNEFV